MQKDCTCTTIERSQKAKTLTLPYICCISIRLHTQGNLLVCFHPGIVSARFTRPSRLDLKRIKFLQKLLPITCVVCAQSHKEIKNVMTFSTSLIIVREARRFSSSCTRSLSNCFLSESLSQCLAQDWKWHSLSYCWS